MLKKNPQKTKTIQTILRKSSKISSFLKILRLRFRNKLQRESNSRGGLIENL